MTGSSGVPVNTGDYWMLRLLNKSWIASSQVLPGSARHIKTVVARLDRAIQYAAASRLNTSFSGILGRPVKPGDDIGICFIHQGRPKRRYPTRNDDAEAPVICPTT
jgi:hypothetical protein